MTGAAVALAMCAALMFGWSTAAMQFDSYTAPAQHGVAALTSHLLRRWRWLTGFAASFAGLGFHAAALSIGALTVVQPLVVTGLVIALLMGDALAGRRPSRSVIGWSGVIVGGLAVFLVAAHTSKGTATPGGVAAALILGLGGIGACACWWASRRVSGAARGVLLGTGTGINFGLIAGTLKAVTGAHGVVDALSQWPIYVLIALGITGFVGNQVAYRQTSLASSLPALNVMNPLVALLFGVVAFRERPATHPVTLVLEVLSLAAVLLGLVMVARREALLMAAPQARVHTAEMASG